jgi:hypothetical protein
MEHPAQGPTSPDTAAGPGGSDDSDDDVVDADFDRN